MTGVRGGVSSFVDMGSGDSKGEDMILSSNIPPLLPFVLSIGVIASLGRLLSNICLINFANGEHKQTSSSNDPSMTSSDDDVILVLSDVALVVASRKFALVAVSSIKVELLSSFNMPLTPPCQGTTPPIDE